MQRVELIGERSKTESVRPIDLDDIDEADLITDKAEIDAIIRRAVTIGWKNQAFTYEELAERLTKNYVVLPESTKERDELFEEAILHIWHREKQIARTALLPLPTRLRYVDPETNEYYHGVVVPAPVQETQEAVESPVSLEPQEMVAADVIDIMERQPELTSAQIARLVFDQLVERKVYDTIIEVKKIAAAIVRYYPDTEPSRVELVIEKIVEDGYVTIRNTGKKKYPRWSVVMDQGRKKEVLEHMAEGTFDSSLNFMFNELHPDNDPDLHHAV